MPETKSYHHIAYDLTIPISLTGRDIEDILVTAFEGGIGYWCRKADIIDGSVLIREKHEATSEFLSRALMVDGAIVLYDTEDENAEHTLSIGAFVHGVQAWVRKRAKDRNLGVSLDNGALDTGSIDAGEADAIVQMGVFGEIVYG